MIETNIIVTVCVNIVGADDIQTYREILELLLPPVVKEGGKSYKTTDMGYVSSKLPEKHIKLVQQLWDQLNSDGTVTN